MAALHADAVDAAAVGQRLGPVAAVAVFAALAWPSVGNSPCRVCWPAELACEASCGVLAEAGAWAAMKAAPVIMVSEAIPARSLWLARRCWG
ncbi:hypothetical protein [Kitasatospora acidiphila]|uniref:hypothetical protein n=1 Tax=Kitasatospora acidiphila TaxID=2567942 RepID=UPI0015F0A6A8|nr:hypothetical protein [Kitasatospora acidiphila]